MLSPSWAELPWTRGPLTLSRAAIDQIDADSLDRYQRREEACGYVRGPVELPLYCDEVVVLENIANKLHKLDPETYFRTADSFFAFNEKKFDDAVTRCRAEGRPVKILYHSHLDAGAYFSATDAAVLSFGEPPAVEGGPSQLGPGPQWPLAFLVVSVGAPYLPETSPGEATLLPASSAAVVHTPAAVLDRRLFVWDGDAFIEAPLSIKEN